MNEYIQRLSAVREPADIMGVDLVPISRMGVEAAVFITNTIDGRGHAFILGSTNPDMEQLNDVISKAGLSGKSTDKLQDIEACWLAQANIKIFEEAIIKKFNNNIKGDKK